MQAFEKTISNFSSVSCKSPFASSLIKRVSGYVFPAFSSISYELSAPITLAFGKVSFNTFVLLPGPQPKSSMLSGFKSVSLFAKSIAGCVRSFRNFSYCSGFQLGISLSLFHSYSSSYYSGHAHCFPSGKSGIKPSTIL